MYWLKCVAVLCLALCVSSAVVTKKDHKRLECLRTPEVRQNAIGVDKCFREMISAKLNNTSEGCTSFDDFNSTFIGFVNGTLQRCYDNATLGNITGPPNTFLSLVKYFMNDTRLKENFHALVWLTENKKNETTACHATYKLPVLNETDIAQTWLRRGLLTYDELHCTRSKKAKECTLAVARMNDNVSLPNIVSESFDISLQNCEKTPINNSSANFICSSYPLLITTAVTAMKLYNSM